MKITLFIAYCAVATQLVAQQAAPAAPDFKKQAEELQHQIEDVTKDLRLDVAALQNLVEYQSFVAHQQQVTGLQRQLANLQQQQRAAQQQGGAGKQPGMPILPATPAPAVSAPTTKVWQPSVMPPEPKK